MTWLFRSLLVIGFGLGVAQVYLGVVNPDVVWLVHVAGRVVDGDVLYQDVMESNPPLIVWLNMPVVLLARALHLRDFLTFQLMLLLSMAATLPFAGTVLRRAIPDRPGLQRGLLLLLLLGWLVPGDEGFGEREQVLLVLLPPYLFAAAARAAGQPLPPVVAWTVGGLAGLGICLKPYFVLVWLVVEGYLLCTRTRETTRIALVRRPENLAVMLVGTLYVGSVLALTPGYLELARQAAPIYADFARKPLSWFLTAVDMYWPACAVLGFMLVRPRAPVHHLAWVLLLAGLAFVATILIQQKGFTNHFYPTTALSLLLLGLLMAETRRRDEPVPRLAGVLLGGVLLLFVWFTLASEIKSARVWRGDPASSDTLVGRLARITQQHARHDYAYVLAVNAKDIAFMVYTDARWRPKYHILWLLPGLYAHELEQEGPIRYHSPAQMSALERDQFESTIQDLLRQRPAVLVVETQYWSARFDFLDYFSQDPRFAAFRASYDCLTTVEHYQVYRRRTL